MPPGYEIREEKVILDYLLITGMLIVHRRNVIVVYMYK